MAMLVVMNRSILSSGFMYKFFKKNSIILNRNAAAFSHGCKPRIAVVTLQTFYLGKHELLTVYLGKLDFLSVTDFSLGNLPRGNFIVWVLDMSRKQ